VYNILTAKGTPPTPLQEGNTAEWEREIDNLVYSLYELTDEEIGIIEN
jgi:hypothetical protein